MTRRVYGIPTNNPELDAAVAGVLSQVPCVSTVDGIAGDVVVLIVTGLAYFDYASLRPLLTPALDGVFDILGVHAPDGDGSVPLVIEDLATLGTYPLDPEALTAVLCEGKEGWFDPGGGTRPERRTERHCS